MIFHEGDLIEIHESPKHSHHSSWNGRRGVIDSYNGISTSWDGSWNCEMEPYGSACHFFSDELTLIESFEQRITRLLGEDYV